MCWMQLEDDDVLLLAFFPFSNVVCFKQTCIITTIITTVIISFMHLRLLIAWFILGRRLCPMDVKTIA